MEPAVITRELTLTEQTITVSVHLPTCGDHAWECRYVISGLPSGQIDHVAHGIDGVQALLCAFSMADASLQRAQRSHGPIHLLGAAGNWFLSPATEPWEPRDGS